MPVDFAALARSVGTVPGVQGCLLLSREGLTLAAEPATEEDRAMAAWSRIAALGDVEKGFVTVNGQMWVVSRRGPFCAIALAEATARPGVILAQLDQVLLAADEERARTREEIRAGGSVPDPAQAPRFRAPLHRDRDRAPGAVPPAGPPAAPPERPAEEPEPAATSAPTPAPSRSIPEEWEIDVVELSREFGGLHGESGPREVEE